MKRILEALKKEQALQRQKIINAGYLPEAIVLRARIRNWFQSLWHVLSIPAWLEETTQPEDMYRKYALRPGAKR